MHTSVKVNPYSGKTIKLLDKMSTQVSINGITENEAIMVHPGNSGCILGVGASQRLGLISISSGQIPEVKKVEITGVQVRLRRLSEITHSS